MLFFGAAGVIFLDSELIYEYFSSAIVVNRHSSAYGVNISAPAARKFTFC